MVTIVIFDMDDTLYDEVDYCRSGFRAASWFISQIPDTPDAETIFNCLWEEFSGGNRKTTFNAAFESLGIVYDEKLIESAMEAYRSHKPQISLPAETTEVLDKLSEKYKLALITDGFLPGQKFKVRALGIEKYFKCIVYTEELGREYWKPSPRGFETILEKLQAKAEMCVYVADNEKKDFIAPNKLGMRTIQLIRPERLHTKEAPNSDGKAEFVIKNITELARLLEKL
ncbi:MAG: HAD family hydrolase [Planctomycetota bacterium]|jgi:putative hydrolase of the HAD superfamily